MPKENKRNTYISKSLSKAIDHLLDRLTDESMEIVIKIKLQKEEEV